MVQPTLIFVLIFNFYCLSCADDSKYFFEGIQKNLLPKYMPLTHLNTPGIIRYFGKENQIHFVETGDGYILEIHRILPPNPQPIKHLPVVLVHALQLNSAAWILTPNNSVGSLLANAGHDVWLVNLRGNSYSQKHKTLSAEDKAFWDFSWDEHGRFDLPAVVDRVLEVTGQSQIILIGHSLGTTSSFVMLSNLTEYQKKVKGLICFGTITDLEALTEPFDRAGMELLMKHQKFIEFIFDYFHIYKIYPFPNAGWKFCEFVPLFCYLSFAFLFEGISSTINLDLIVEFQSFFPDYSSYKTFLHYAQVHAAKRFQAFDFGDPQVNLQHYGSITPTFYDLRAISTPVGIFWGNMDLTSTPDSALTTTKLLPNVQLVHGLPFAHIDYVMGKDISTAVYPLVEKLIKNWSQI